VSGSPVFDLHYNDLHVRRAGRPNSKHIACSPGALKRRPPGWLWVVAWVCAAATAAHAQPVPPAEIPRPEEPPVFVQPSAVGDLEYRAGRGLRVGNTGITVGGFATMLADHKEEGGETRFTLDDLNLFTLFDPTPYFHVFSELGFQNLIELGDEQTKPEPRDSVTVDRLYGDLNLNDRVNLRFGKFFTPVGRWNEIPAEPLVWTTSRPLVTEGPFDEQVTGGMVWGSVFPGDGSLTYKLYGQFLQALAPDSRIPAAYRSAGARIEYTSLGGWGIGSSYFASARQGRWDHVGGFDALWQGEGSEVMGEFLAGRADPDGKHIVGFYIQGVRELIHTLSLVGRYEYFDPGDPRPAVDLFDIGLSWRPSPYLVTNLDYLFADRSAGIDRSEQNLPGLRIALSILF
jgi:hypothetical protein